MRHRTIAYTLAYPLPSRALSRLCAPVCALSRVLCPLAPERLSLSPCAPTPERLRLSPCARVRLRPCAPERPGTPTGEASVRAVGLPTSRE